MILIKSVNISEEKGTVKVPVDQIRLTRYGVKGDAHSGNWNRQVSLLGTESIRRFEKDSGRKTRPGEFAENITTEGFELWKVHPLDRFICNNLEMEVTQIGKECHGSHCSIFREVGNCVMPKEGIFARVIREGTLQAGDQLDYQPKVFRILVLTLSDRASAGEYADLSGARIQEMAGDFFTKHARKYIMQYALIPDDAQKLEEMINQAKYDSADLVITTGGTGIGPRDFTPDVVRPMLDKEIPGIMDMIRLKYGTEKPNALLSRSIAGVMGKSLIFTLPGSLRAVNEYFGEISKSLLHMVYMLHGLDTH